jgi:hypothetical protein
MLMVAGGTRISPTASIIVGFTTGIKLSEKRIALMLEARGKEKSAVNR